MSVLQKIEHGLIPARLTVDEVYALVESGVLDDDERFELIDGEIVPMSSKANWHSMMEGRLNEALVKMLAADMRLFPAPSIRLADDLLLEPDFCVMPRHVKPLEMRGTDLLLVVEVADSSLAKDLGEKATHYAQHGVRDYWVVDAVQQIIHVHRAPINDTYTDIDQYEREDVVSALLLSGISIRLDTLD